MNSKMLFVLGLHLAVLFAILIYHCFKMFRINHCPVCFWGKLRVFNAREVEQAIRNGSFRTTLTLFARVHLRCQRCAEVYCRKLDGGLERTELPTTHPIEEEERI